MRHFMLGMLACASGIAAMPASSDDRIAGPIEVAVVRVIDGDTFVGDAHVWPGQWVRVAVRIRGIDAPELKARCASERQAAQRARAALETMLDGRRATITEIGGGKYFGRVLANVSTLGQRQVAGDLLEAGLVRAYDGGRRADPCPVPE